jgi:uncharacterized protein YfaS (alpha-2-macroglobulin family)
VNSALATTSKIDAAAGNAPVSSEEEGEGGGSPYDESEGDGEGGGYYGNAFYHQEIRHDFARFYADYFDGSQVTLTYTMQAIASGTFSSEATHAEEMYDPDVFGKAKPVKFTIKEKKD